MSPVFLRKSAPIFGVLEVDFLKLASFRNAAWGEIVSFVSSAQMFLFDCLCNILVCLRCRFSGPGPVNLSFIWVYVLEKFGL